MGDTEGVDSGRWPHGGCEKRRESKNGTRQRGGCSWQAAGGGAGEGPLPGAAWARGQASGSAFPEQRAGEEVGWWAGGIIVLTAGWVSMKL